MTTKDRQRVARLRQALAASQARRYSLAEILSCGCEPDIEHCTHCDSRRLSNTRIDHARRILDEPGNTALLLPILDQRERDVRTLASTLSDIAVARTEEETSALLAEVLPYFREWVKPKGERPAQ